MNFKNEHFDSATCEFEVLGFFEDLTNAATGEYLGLRRIAEPTRPLGAAGALEFDLTENVVLQKGAVVYTLKTKRGPRRRRVVGMIQVLCGRTKERK